MRRVQAVAGGLALGAVVLVAQLVARVPDDEMAPSLLPGDLVLITPGDPAPGDVVAVVDPLDGGRWTLRRVEARGGAVRYVDGAFRTASERVPVTDMGSFEGHRVHKQAGHLVRHLERPVDWDMPERGVPDDALFVSADARDEAMDSRWWGAIPVGAVQGVVRLRVGVPTHPWRGWATTAP